jgi:hypothetical protein
MISNATPWMYEHALYNGVATQSLRTDHSTTKNLSRTPSSESNKRTFTFSTWLKRSFLDYSTLETVHQIFSSQVDGNDYFAIFFQDDGKLYVDGYHTSQQLILVTNRLFRDTGAWYHLVVAVDTTQGTASNRIKIYVNGIQETSFSTETYPSQNYDTYINDDVKHTLGSSFDNSSQAFGGYFAETNLVDGTQLAPTSFGETKNGVWIAKKYTGSYGTNGFRLQFDQTGTGTASASTIGADTSGNNNHYASSGIVASDCAMPDSPENNFCTINPLDKSTDFTLSDGNLKVASGGSNNGNSRSTFAVSSGKWYWEARVNNTGTAHTIGITTKSASLSTYLGNHANDYAYARDGTKWNNNSSSSYGSSYANGDNIGIALDLDSGTITFYKNGSSQGTAFSSLSGEFFPAFGDIAGADDINWIANFGQDSTFAGAISAGGNADANGVGDFAYAPPSGYLALCTANLPEPTIGGISSTLPTDHFDIVLRNGTGSEATQALGFKPDFLWTKTRSHAVNHNIASSSLTYNYSFLQSNTTEPENTSASHYYMTPTSTGYTVGTGDNINQSGRTFVDWLWKANGGTTSSNTDGSITSTVQANTDAGFSIVTYSGNATSGATIGHGLSPLVPKFVIIKNRDTAGNWTVRTTAVDGSSDLLQLNLTDAKADSARSAPTSTVFSVGSGDVENKSGNNLVAYCFAEVEGYSKIGSYTGNGSTDGTFVFTGFRPAFIMWKRTDSSTGGEWVIQDTTRREFNPMNVSLYPNLSNAEATGETFRVQDTLSNGFKLRASASQCNASGGTYIYMAFAEAPFKYANAR